MNLCTTEKNVGLIDLIKNIPGGCCIYSVELQHIKFTAWNNYMEEITGYTMKEINKIGWNNIIYSTHPINDFIDRVSIDKDYEIITKDGVKKIINMTTSIINSENGKFNILALVRDITKYKHVEQELQELEERYEKILELSPDSILIHNDEKLIYANKSSFKMFGIENPKGVIGDSVYKYIDPNFHDIVKSRIKDQTENKASVPIIEETLITPSGETIIAEVTSSYIPYKGKICAFTLIRNINSKKRLENKLRESELMLRQVTENSLDLITISDTNGIIQYGTPSNKDTLGYDLEDFVGLNVFHLVHPNDLDYAKTQLEEMKRTLQERTIQCSLRCKDGSYKCLEIKGKVLHDDGQSEKFIFSSRDISERIKVQKVLKESEKRYKQLIELLPFGVYIFNKDQIFFSNKTGLDYLGVSNLEEIKDRCYLEIVQPHPTHINKHLKSVEQIKANKYIPSTEEKFIRLSDNKILDFETVVTPYAYEHEEGKYLVVLRDISDKKKAEELEKDMKEKSRLLHEATEYERLRTEFFANISHELRTPINVILSSLQLINLKTNNMNETCWCQLEDYKKYPSIMKQNCYRLIRLINNLIDVTKIDSGYFSLNLINTNIVNIVENITLSVVEYTKEKGISLIFDTDIEEKIIACDPDKIERIILNLISNSVKFTEPGGNILVNIMDKGQNLIISVKDTGIGISEDKLKMIFERFVQVDKSLTRNREGSGIGLSLVESLVEMHKGIITAKSEINKGSEFIINLPCNFVEEKNHNSNTNNYFIQGKSEKINIEFSDIYY